jgi:hypothetical protein
MYREEKVSADAVWSFAGWSVEHATPTDQTAPTIINARIRSLLDRAAFDERVCHRSSDLARD